MIQEQKKEEIKGLVIIVFIIADIVILVINKELKIL